MSKRRFLLLAFSIGLGFWWQLGDLSLEEQQPVAGMLVLVAAALWLRRSLASPDERKILRDPARLLAGALTIRLLLTVFPPGWEQAWFRQTLATAWLWTGLVMVLDITREAKPDGRRSKRHRASSSKSRHEERHRRSDNDAESAKRKSQQGKM